MTHVHAQISYTICLLQTSGSYPQLLICAPGWCYSYPMPVLQVLALVQDWYGFHALPQSHPRGSGNADGALQTSSSVYTLSDFADLTCLAAYQLARRFWQCFHTAAQLIIHSCVSLLALRTAVLVVPGGRLQEEQYFSQWWGSTLYSSSWSSLSRPINHLCLPSTSWSVYLIFSSTLSLFVPLLFLLRSLVLSLFLSSSINPFTDASFLRTYSQPAHSLLLLQVTLCR